MLYFEKKKQKNKKQYLSHFKDTKPNKKQSISVTEIIKKPQVMFWE